jgi:glutamate synthase domain-containing protein 2
MSNEINTSLNMMAASPMTSTRGKGSGSGEWFEALSQAWGETLDQQATRIETMSNQMGEGAEDPSQVTKLTTESMRMSFLSNSSATSIDSVGKALETMARKN